MSKEFDYYSVILNKNNIVPNTKNSVFKYQFRQAITFKEASMTMGTLNIFNSWYNISESLNNNRFSYKWFDTNGDLADVYEVVFNDGSYTINDMNEFMQSILVSRGHFLKEVSSGNYIYHFEFVTNSTYYSAQLNVYAMRTSPAGTATIVRGNTSWSYPDQYTCPQIIFNSTNKFNLLLGFNNGTYPETSDHLNHTFLSDFTPDMNPVSSLNMACSICDQGYISDPGNILYSFTAGSASFGSMIEKQPVNDHYIKIRNGQYLNFTVEFLDQEYKRVEILDPSTVISLNFKVPREKVLFEE